jgi:pimeloyl-ACP methyl ester carboxylesterase
MSAISNEVQPFRVMGNGQPLLLIHGSGGDLDTYAAIEAALATRYRVVTYQRRAGVLDGTSGTYSLTLDDHVNDALSVLRACGGHPAYVFGSSAGAVIGLSLLSTHPESVLGMIAHEPPLLQILDDGIELYRRFTQVLRIESEEGTEAACAAFFDLTGILGSIADPFTSQVAKAVAARPVPPIREIHPILDYIPDLGKLSGQRHKLTLGIGGFHSRSMPIRATSKLGELIDLAPRTFPGNHFGYMDYLKQNDPVRFQEVIVETLAGRAQR